MNNKEQFLKELTELTKKYNIAIGGCGCCGSPYLYKLEYDFDEKKLMFNEYIDDCLKFNDDVGFYTTEENEKEIDKILEDKDKRIKDFLKSLEEE